MPTVVLTLVVAVVLASCTQQTVRTGIRSGSSFRPVQPPAPSIERDAVAAAAALEAFHSLIGQPDLSYHFEEHQRATTGANATPTTIDLAIVVDVTGSDFDAVISANGGVGKFRAVGGMLWTQANGKAWARSPQAEGLHASDLVSPWRYLGNFSKLVFVSKATDTAGGYEFANTSTIGVQTGLTNLLGIMGVIRTMRCDLLADGTPVTITFDADSSDGEGGTITYSDVVTITNVGKPIVIKPPA